MSCDSTDPKVPPPSRKGDGAPPVSPTEIDSVTLMAGHRELLIRHAQELYRLRVTAQGKLILTK
jgi:hemin uptake protein HemP